MANKKINELDNRASLSLADLMVVGDPTTGYAYKTTLSDLKTITGAGVISFNGRFGAVSPTEGDYTLTLLGDVLISSPSSGQVLKYNGTQWVNSSEDSVPVTSVFGRTGAVVATEGDYNLTQLGDVNITSPAAFNLLAYDGTEWRNRTTSSLNIITGGGVIGYMPKFATTSYNLEASQIFDNATAVMINTTTPNATGARLQVNGSISATSFIRNGGTSSQFLKADGSVDSSVYITSSALSGYIQGSGTTNQLAYFTGASTIASLSTATYPSLIELSYVKGVTSAIQTQLDSKASSSSLGNYLPLTGGTLSGDLNFSDADIARVAFTNSGSRLFVGQSPTTSYMMISGSTRAGGNTISFLNSGGSTLTLNANNTATFFGALSGTSATFSSSVTANGNATSSAVIFNNAIGAGGTAQHYADFTSGATVLGRISRGNGASGLEPNGLNIDNFSGFKVRLNQLGGSGGSFTIDGGNLGIGVTPSAWRTAETALQIGAVTSVTNVSGFSVFRNNNYVNSSLQEIYLTSAPASALVLSNNGEFRWLTAPSGTAGNAITFTQAMTLDASGRLGIGTGSPSRKLDVNGTGVLFANTGGAHEILFGDNNYRYFGLYTPSSPDYFSFRNGTTNLLTVTASGRVLIGATDNLTDLLQVAGSVMATGRLEVSVNDLSSIFVTNPTTSGSTTGSGIGFKAYNGTSVAQSAGIILTSNTWSFGTYSANQLSIGSDGTGGLALRSANSAPITFFTGGSTAGLSTERMRITSAGKFVFSNTPTSSSASSAVNYLSVTVNGTDYLIPLHNLP